MGNADARRAFVERAAALGLQVDAAESAALEDGVRLIGELLATVDEAQRLPSEDPGSFVHFMRGWRESLGG